jgi:hypothetical protein
MRFGRGHPWVLNRVGVDQRRVVPVLKRASACWSRFSLGLYRNPTGYILACEATFSSHVHMPVKEASATPHAQPRRRTARSLQGAIGPDWSTRLSRIPFRLVRDLTSIYRQRSSGRETEATLMRIHLHVAGDREEAIRNGAFAGDKLKYS